MLLREGSYDYIFVDQRTNQVHLLVPIVGGDSIGLDNTCQSAKELKQFFGLEVHTNELRHSALHVLRRMRDDLRFDIGLLSQIPSQDAGEENVRKQARLAQVDTYIATLERIAHHPALGCLSAGLAEYPSGVTQILGDRTNCLSMHLAPEVPDTWLRTQHPVFRLNRGHGINSFARMLRTQFASLPRPAQPNPRERLLDAVAQKFSGNGYNQVPQIIAFMQAELQRLSPPDAPEVDLNHAQHGRVQITADYLVNLSVVEQDDTSREYAEQILLAALNDTYWTSLSPANLFAADYPQHPEHHTLSRYKETLSVLTQFFIAQVNLFCYAHGISEQDFGQIIEHNARFHDEIATIVRNALRTGDNVEQQLITWFNQHRQNFGMNRELNVHDTQAIIGRFQVQWQTIKESPHLDEFIVLFPEVAGDFVAYKNRISCPFAQLIEKGFPELYNQFYQQKRTQFREARFHLLPEGKLPHTSQVPIEINFEYRDIAALLNTNQVDQAVSLLLLETNDSNRMFQNLSDADITQLKAYANWPAVLRMVMQRTENQHVLDVLGVIFK